MSLRWSAWLFLAWSANARHRPGEGPRRLHRPQPALTDEQAHEHRLSGSIGRFQRLLAVNVWHVIGDSPLDQWCSRALVMEEFGCFAGFVGFSAG